MLNIAYCDDVDQDRTNIMYSLSQIEDNMKVEFEIASFSSGEQLCENLKKNNYDVILLDILMTGINGIETAQRIRSMGSESLIIFISNYDEMLRELFDYGTIAFLDKPLKTDELEIALKKAFKLINKDSVNVFSYQKKGSTYYVPITDIMYFEANLNHVIIHTIKEQIEYTDVFKNVWRSIEKNLNFIMPNRSYIYNLKYVSLKSNIVVLKTTSESQNIGRNYKDDTYVRFYNYMEMRSE